MIAKAVASRATRLRADCEPLKGRVDRMSVTDDPITGVSAARDAGNATHRDAPKGKSPKEPRSEDNFIPMWLAVLVLVLLLAVTGVGGFVIRGVVAGDRPAVTREQLEVNSWLKQVSGNQSDPELRLGLGYAYQQAGQYDKALSEYAFVLKTDPRNTAALYNRGVVYLHLGLGDKAEASWWAALAVDKTQALAAKSLGDYYAGQKHYRSLVVAVKPAAQAHPEMADLQYLMGLAYEKQGDTALAIARYRLALKYTPDMVDARAGLKRLGVAK